ncbi:patatin-like phospholipase family protein [Membranicola marinus]|uniref:Patatin-like phospholipase family protein n=1 Tax=Membranihabitans marinus TaxID=1227546 RepID=A0A953HU10_9BACT|nr:patatin-like phospholipase family protein [Membranihabitans marinus]MBY5958415.1 patatin-like phospholipase family protein [Membranihabitans marinus]
MTPLQQRLTRPGPKRILSLDGGGVRGILTLGFLERMEMILREQHDNPDLLLCDYFDLIGGTSTGSIIATGLALGMPVSELTDYYMTLGDKIFGKKKNLLRYLTKGEKYDIKPLNKSLKDVLGDVKLGDQDKVKTGLCIVTKRADTFSTWPFHNHPEGKYYDLNKDIPLWKVVRASAAAPTYFLPLILDIGNKEKGSFIDGGISMANNPSLTLLLLATLKGYPFHWQMGTDQLKMVSVGTGSLSRKYSYSDFKHLNLMDWASMLPDHFMTDANYYNQVIMQILSDSPTATEIDSEIGDLKLDSLNGKHALSYLRYDVLYDRSYLAEMGLDFSEKEVKNLSSMDNYRNISTLYDIGRLAAERHMKTEHFPDRFSLNHPSGQPVKRFTQNKGWNLDFEMVKKKPLAVEAVQINEPFEVETIEGVMKGKPGDYLMKGVRGELYVCDRSIYDETYEGYDTGD